MTELASQEHTHAESDDNTSGMRAGVPAGIERMGWCWGAFGLNWIWGLAHNVPYMLHYIGGTMVAMYGLGILAMLTAASPRDMPLWMSGIGWFLRAVTLGVSVYLGLYGYRLAWRHRRFESLRRYREQMRAWDRFGFGLTLVGVILTIVRAVQLVRLEGSRGLLRL